jgi:hypothetical protein
MQLRFEMALALTAAFAFSVVACGSDDDDSGAAGSAGTGGSAGSGGGTTTVKIGGTFVDYLSKAPIEGLEVCTLIPEGRDPGCAETISTGQIVADGFPTNSEVLFRLRKDEYLTTLIPAVTGDKDDTGSTLFPVKTADANMLLGNASLSFDSGKGAISFIADQSKPGSTAAANGQEDVGVTISPAGGTFAYLNGVMLDTTATATFGTGLGIIVNLDPGDYTLTFTHADLTCTTRLGWTTDKPNVSKVRVQADAITYVLHQCGQ